MGTIQTDSSNSSERTTGKCIIDDNTIIADSPINLSDGMHLSLNIITVLNS